MSAKPLDVTCPTCLSKPGLPCMSGIRPGKRKGWRPGGRKQGYIHVARRDLASSK